MDPDLEFAIAVDSPDWDNDVSQLSLMANTRKSSSTFEATVLSSKYAPFRLFESFIISLCPCILNGEGGLSSKLPVIASILTEFL